MTNITFEDFFKRLMNADKDFAIMVTVVNHDGLHIGLEFLDSDIQMIDSKLRIMDLSASSTNVIYIPCVNKVSYFDSNKMFLVHTDNATINIRVVERI